MYTRREIEEAGQRGLAVSEHKYGYACRMLDRFTLVADREDHGFTPHARGDGYWEAWITAWMMRELRGRAFVDVGANMGYYTLLAASMGCPTIAFEPQPQLVRCVEASLEINGWSEDVYTVQAAVGDHDHEAQFTVPKHHGMLATYAYDVRSPEYEHVPDSYVTYPVKVVTLDGLADWSHTHPLLVKIDAEGAEPQVWAGMQRLLDRPLPTTVILEFRADRYPDPAAFAHQLFKHRVSYVDEMGNEVVLDSPTPLLERPDHDWMVVVDA
jgi:FkbM family methyltransferase